MAKKAIINVVTIPITRFIYFFWKCKS